MQKHKWFQRLLGKALIILACPIGAMAADYPLRPVTIISPTVPGGQMDSVARLVAERLAPRLGQPVVVDAKPGGGGALGMALVARAKPDGHTLVITADSFLTVAPRLVRGVGFEPLKDFEPVVEIGSSPMVLLANPLLGVRSLDEFIAKARTVPGAISYGSGGNGSPHHLSMALLERGAGIKLSHVPYKGGAQAFGDVLGNHVSSMFIVMSTADAQLRSGKLVPLGVTSQKRLADYPDIPAIAEKVPNYEMETWFAIFAPAGTPKAVVDRLNREIAALLKEPEVIQKMKVIGMTPAPGTPDALAKKLRLDMTRMEQLIQDTGIKAE